MLFRSPPNYGPGALESNNALTTHDTFNEVEAKRYYKQMEQQCISRNVAVSVFAAGNSSFEVKMLHEMVLGTGGQVILHKDFGEALAKDVATSLRIRKYLNALWV